MAEIHGTSAPEYSKLGELLSSTIDNGKDVGASVSVDDETVVDIDRKISFAYVMNRGDEGLLGDTRGINLAQEVFQH